MEFWEFERPVLRVLFETRAPVTAHHLAYLGGLSVRGAERRLAKMVEDGTLLVRCNREGQIEYYAPSRRLVARESGEPDSFAPPFSPTARPANSLTAVMLSLLVPGAGHIYTGRSGAGVAWMATTLAGYACCFLPGLFLHGLCLVSAAQQRQY